MQAIVGNKSDILQQRQGQKSASPTAFAFVPGKQDSQTRSVQIFNLTSQFRDKITGLAALPTCILLASALPTEFCCHSGVKRKNTCTQLHNEFHAFGLEVGPVHRYGCCLKSLGCPVLSRLYTNRHNAIGRLILRAIMRGPKGGYVVMMGRGSDSHCSAEGLVTRHSHRIPEAALPASMPVDVKGLVQRQTIPDALLYKTTANGHNAEYWIGELKFCRDNKKERKLVQAVEQHNGLCSAIQQADHNATVHRHYIPLVIGVAGSIYKELSSHMVALGLNGQDLKATIRAIHLKTTKLLHWTYTTKQKKEHSKEKRAPWKRKRR